MKMHSVVLCEFCDDQVPATFVCAQSTDQGATVDWHMACADHVTGWNEGGDWAAPVFALGERME